MGRVLSVVARATGYVHITTDARVDVRPVIVVPLEQAHVVAALDIATLLERLAYSPPARFTELTP